MDGDLIMKRLEKLVNETHKDAKFLLQYREGLVSKQKELLDKQNENDNTLDGSINEGIMDKFKNAFKAKKDINDEITKVNEELQFVEQKIEENRRNGVSDLQEKILMILEQDSKEYRPKIDQGIKDIKTHLEAIMAIYDGFDTLKAEKANELYAAISQLGTSLDHDAAASVRDALERKFPYVPANDELVEFYRDHFKFGTYKDI